MPEFYAEVKADVWNIWATLIDAEDADEASFELVCAVPESYVGLPIQLTNQETLETTTILTLNCPECMTPVMDYEEWMLTDKAGVYQHVDCYHPKRVRQK
jgi:hypothetical protein